jgi:hypothetical protein
MTTVSIIKPEFSRVTTENLRSWMGEILGELRSRKAEAEGKPTVSSLHAQVKTPRNEKGQITKKADSTPRTWGLQSSAGKTLKRRYESQEQASACIPALMAQTGLTYVAVQV